MGHSIIKKEKKQLANKIEELDKKAETMVLTPNEAAFKHCLNERLAHLLREEELKWYQRVKVKDLLEGDNNTKYFQLVANGKHRKQQIYKLENEDGSLIRESELKKYITKYYKGLFGKPEHNNFTLDETITIDIPQVSDQENEILTAPFHEEEVRGAIFQMEHNKAPDPDGFPAEFY